MLTICSSSFFASDRHASACRENKFVSTKRGMSVCKSVNLYKKLQKQVLMRIPIVFFCLSVCLHSIGPPVRSWGEFG